MTTYIAPRTIEELAKRLTAAAGLRAMPSFVWSMILMEVPDPFRPIPETEFQSLLDATRRVLAMKVRGGDTQEEHRVRAAASKTRGLLTASDRRRATYETRRRAEMAMSDDLVVRTRTRLLGGKTLTPAEAVRLLESPATKWLPAYYFLFNKIPIGAHDSKIVQPDGTRGASWDKETVIRISAGANQWDYPYAELQRHRCDLKHSIAATMDGHDRFEHVVEPGSLLEEVGRASAELAMRYAWPDHQALWYLLTGEVPQLDPVSLRVSARYGTRGTFAAVTLVIEPWVAAETVRRVYLRAQQAYFKQPSKCPELTSFAVYDFVESKLAGSEGIPKWPDLGKAWRRGASKQRFNDRSAFQRVYRRTRHWLIDEIWFPAYRIFSPPKPRHAARPRKSKGR